MDLAKRLHRFLADLTRGPADEVARATWIGLSWAGLLAVASAPYAAYLASSAYTTLATLVLLVVAGQLTVIVLLRTGHLTLGHGLQIALNLSTVPACHLVVGPEARILDHGVAMVIYPMLVFVGARRRALLLSLALWSFVTTVTPRVAAADLGLGSGSRALAEGLAPHSALMLFALYAAQLAIFERDRHRVMKRSREHRAGAVEAERRWRLAAGRERAEHAMRRADEARLARAARRAGLAQVTERTMHELNRTLNHFVASEAAVESAVEELEPRRLTNLQTSLRDLDQPWSRGAAMGDYLEALAGRWRAARALALDELEALATAAERTAAVVSRQQALSRHRDAVEELGLVDMIDEATSLCVGDRDRLELHVQPARVRCVSSVLREALLAVMTNAVEASPPATPISVRARVHGGELEIEVVDEGEGFDEHARCFEAGWSTRSAVRGFGLHAAANGLRSVGGRLELQSEGPRRGARARLTVPVIIDAGVSRCAR